jgi:arylformamidase
MDAPFHFHGDGATIDRVPLASCFGPAYIVRLEHRVPNGVIGVAHLAPHEAELRAMHRVLIDTGWYRRWRSPEYFVDYPVISTEAAWFLVESKVELVGVDFPSVDRAPNETHRVLLGAGIVIVENLTALDAVPVDAIEFAAFPLRITGRDGSPVRAVAMLDE